MRWPAGGGRLLLRAQGPRSAKQGASWGRVHAQSQPGFVFAVRVRGGPNRGAAMTDTAVHERESVAGHRCSPCSRRRSTQQARSEARCPATRMGTGGPARNRTAVDGFAIRVPAPLAEASSVSSGDVTAARHEGNMRAGPHEGGAVRAPEEGPDVAREVARCDGPIPTRLPAGLSEAELLRGYPPRVPHPFEVVVLGALIACSAACAMGVWPWPLPAGGAS